MARLLAFFALLAFLAGFDFNAKLRTTQNFLRALATPTQSARVSGPTETPALWRTNPQRHAASGDADDLLN